MARSVRRSGSGGRPRLGRPRRAYWQALLAAWRRSGLAQREFCRRRGLAPGTFGWWKYTLTREAGEPQAPRVGADPGLASPAFVPVRIVAARARSAERRPEGAGAVEIVLGGGRRVRVRGRVEPAWLAAVVQALEAGRC